MKNLIILNIPKIGIAFVILLLTLPLIFKNFILNIFGLNELSIYYEVVSSIASGIAVIIAFISLKEQQNEIQKQNSRLDFNIRVESLTKALEIKKMIAQANPGLKEDSEWVDKATNYLKALESSLDKMIDETTPKS